MGKVQSKFMEFDGAINIRSGRAANCNNCYSKELLYICEKCNKWFCKICLDDHKCGGE